MIRDVRVNNVLRERWDDGSRTVTLYDAAGAQTSTRPYTAAEITNDDAGKRVEAARLARLDYDRAVGLAAAPAALAALQAASIIPGAAWRQPTGAHDAYPLDATVTFGGKTWTNLTPANVWTPGVSGWAEVTAGPPAWLQPTGAQDAYPLGAKVTYQGQTWTNTIAANVWAPGVAGWTVTP